MKPRHFTILALLAVGIALVSGCKTGGARAQPPANAVSLFDGKTLDGWMQLQNNAASFGGGDITDMPAFAKKLTDKSDPVSAFISGQLDDAVKTDLTAFAPSNSNAKAVRSILVKNLNKIVSGASIYDAARFRNIPLRSETDALLKSNPRGQELARFNKLLIEDAYPELAKSTSAAWVVKDGAIASTGAGRGVIYTVNDFSHYRLMFTMRHVSGKPDHQACILIFCTRPAAGEKPLDALGGIQFQVPNGGHWDYRPGQNKGGGAEFTTVTKTKYDVHQWSCVEILVDASKGTVRMAVAQPPGKKAVEVLDFKVPEAGKTSPIAWQMHNGGLFDEYKDVSIEVDPAVDDLITTK
jgi:hypothetical protein